MILIELIDCDDFNSKYKQPISLLEYNTKTIKQMKMSFWVHDDVL